jgi:hypothetical protein
VRSLVADAGSEVEYESVAFILYVALTLALALPSAWFLYRRYRQQEAETVLGD